MSDPNFNKIMASISRNLEENAKVNGEVLSSAQVKIKELQDSAAASVQALDEAKTKVAQLESKISVLEISSVLAGSKIVALEEGAKEFVGKLDTMDAKLVNIAVDPAGPVEPVQEVIK